MPRSRWTRERIARLAYLAGRGLDAKEIADHRDIGSTRFAVETAARVVGIGFPEKPEGAVMVSAPAAALRAFERQARDRGQSGGDLMSTLIRIFADDPVLLANVLDDEW